jgi:hypothetical protein
MNVIQMSIMKQLIDIYIKLVLKKITLFTTTHAVKFYKNEFSLNEMLYCIIHFILDQF